MRKTMILLVFILLFSCTKNKQNNISDEINTDNNINGGYLWLETYKNVLFEKSTLSSQELLEQTVFDGNIAELDKLITISQLCNFTRSNLRILRNTIFAKYGYKFNSIDLQDHFSKFSWYSGVTSNVDDKLTKADLNNIELIQKIEDNYPEDNELIGNWVMYGAIANEGIDNISLLLARSDYVWILPNGIYVDYCRAHFWSEEIFFGLWSLENNVFETIIIENDKKHDFPPNYGKADLWIYWFDFNDGSRYPACHLFGDNSGGWVKEK